MPRSVIFSAFLLPLVLVGCITAPKPIIPPPLPPPQAAMARYLAVVRLDSTEIPAFEDRMETTSLRAAAMRSLSYYQRLPSDQAFVLGKDTFTAQDFAESMAAFINLIDSSPTAPQWAAALRDTFAVYQSVGVDSDRTVTFSSYYEPTISAK